MYLTVYYKNRLFQPFCTLWNRSLLEYASEVWDSCNLSDTKRLEQMQLSAYPTTDIFFT